MFISRHYNTASRRIQRQWLLPLLACLLAFAAPARADTHTDSAFLFAERKDWDNARAHARSSGNAALQKLITWLYIRDQDSGASFDEIAHFIRTSPGWPNQQRTLLRAEQSLRTSDTDDATLAAWFEANPPVSGIGKIKLAELLMRRGDAMDSEKVRFLIRDAWRNGDFDENEEQRILAVYGDSLREQDHISRADRLLWEEKTRPVKRMLPLLPPAQQKLARARSALMDGASDATFHLSQVPRANLNDPGLIYARMQWRAAKKDDAGVRELLLAAPSPVPYPEKWWRQRELQIRSAIDDKQYGLARKLLANHSQAEGQALADATWLSGWLSLQFLNNPHDAYTQFYRMFDSVKFPVSKSRAAYWAGRAAERAGDAEAAKNWFANAAAFPTTYYGQLAIARTKGEVPLRLPADPAISGEEKQRFNGNEVVRAIRAAGGAGAYDIATTLLNAYIDSAESAAQAALAAQLGAEIHSNVLGVRGAKRAMQRGIVLTEVGYPQVKASGLDVEPALALAITRQESEFDPRARSKAGATGMMQLLPGTARETARKEGIGYSESQLHDPAYNMRLGSAYLNRLIVGYDGSYVLAIAAYNAGPGNVRGWMANFGVPGARPDDAVDWVEKIPFAETRNYVQRVMENLQVYRHLQNSKTPLLIVSDLTRAQ